MVSLPRSIRGRLCASRNHRASVWCGMRVSPSQLHSANRIVAGHALYRLLLVRNRERSGHVRCSPPRPPLKIRFRRQLSCHWGTGGGAARVPAHHPGARTGSPPRLRQEDLGEGASAGESIRSGRRSARGVDARWRPMRLRGEHGPAAVPPGINFELHHVDPFARGGPPTTANLTLRCRAHNRHQAEQDFGREHIARKSAARYVGEGVKDAPAG